MNAASHRVLRSLARAAGLGPGLLTVLALVSPASAQLDVQVQGIERPSRLVEALSEELGEAAIDEAERGRARLRIVVAAGGRATLTFTLGDGSERTRTVEVSADEEAAILELTLVGSNLVRDQASDLIGDAPAAAAERAPEVAATEAAAPRPAAPRDAAPRETAPTEAAPTEAAPREAAPAEAESSLPLEAPSPRSFAEARPLSLGVAGYFGVQLENRSGGTNATPFGTYGLSLGVAVDPHVALGLTRVSLLMGASSLESFVLSLEGTPFVELFGFLDPHVQVYGQLGLAMQGRSQTAVREGLFQVAPFLGGGVRFWLTDFFTIGVELGAQVVLTDAYSVMGASLPQFSTPATVGLSAEWHISP